MNTEEGHGTCQRHQCNAVCFEQLLTEGPHYGKIVCQRGHWQRWISKPKENDKGKRNRPGQADLVRKFSAGYCQLCGRMKEAMRSRDVLEAHHVIEFEHGGKSTRENIWILCTPCHKHVHFMRTYYGNIVKPLSDALTSWAK